MLVHLNELTAEVIFSFQIILMFSVFFFMMAIYESFEYVCCYNEDKIAAYKKASKHKKDMCSDDTTTETTALLSDDTMMDTESNDLTQNYYISMSSEEWFSLVNSVLSNLTNGRNEWSMIVCLIIFQNTWEYLHSRKGCVTGLLPPLGFASYYEQIRFEYCFILNDKKNNYINK